MKIKLLKWYYNGALFPLFTGIIGIIITTFLTMMVAMVAPAACDFLFKAGLATTVIIFCVPVAYLVPGIRKLINSNPTFIATWTPFGRVVCQCLIEEGNCPVKDIPSRPSKVLTPGIYYCYTHDVMISRLERDKNIEILRKVYVQGEDITKIKRAYTKKQICKDCNKKSKCPFFSQFNSYTNMYGIKFRVNK